MWVARNRDGSLKLFLSFIAERVDPLCNSFWVCNYESSNYETGLHIDPSLLPDITFENSPMEVGLTLIDNINKEETK